LQNTLEKASQHINVARNISSPHANKTLTSSKHYQAEEQLEQLGGILKIAEKVGKSEPQLLQQFLLHLSEKIQQDGEKDKQAGRIKLADELFACATLLRSSSESIH
jgi:AraC-like DNA-binding protein